MNIPGLHILSLPAPLPSGNINVYFVDKPYPTLIDTPPKDPAVIASLESALRVTGHSISDIRRIIITHPHFDHFGAAGYIAEKSGAEVWASRGTAHYLNDYASELSADFSYYRDLFSRAGVPESQRTCLWGFYERAKASASTVKVSKVLDDEDKVWLSSIPFKVMQVPGHTPWCLLMHDKDTGVAFTGDFLIKEISSNAIVQRPMSMSPGYKSLKAYIQSLNKVRRLGLSVALPGHGEIIDNPEARIMEVLSSIEKRREQVLRVIGQDVCTPFQIAEELFPALKEEHVLLAISEVIGHLELLEEEGVVKRDGGPTLRFSTDRPQ